MQPLLLEATHVHGKAMVKVVETHVVEVATCAAVFYEGVLDASFKRAERCGDLFAEDGN